MPKDFKVEYYFHFVLHITHLPLPTPAAVREEERGDILWTEQNKKYSYFQYIMRFDDDDDHHVTYSSVRSSDVVWSSRLVGSHASLAW